MKINCIFNRFFRAVNSLVVLFAIAFSFPSSGHANMMHSMPADHHIGYNELSSDDTQTAHDVQTADMDCGVFHAKYNDTQESSSNCCSNMCVAAVLLTFGIMTDADEVHAHIALPNADMASADPSRLMRPPSL